MNSTDILVMKFGGASVKDPEAVKNVAKIIRLHSNKPLLVVISAMDKTTNHLEKLAYHARDCEEKETWAQFNRIRDFHLEIVETLFQESPGELMGALENFFMEVERIIRGLLLLGEFPRRTYDRIVSYGELLSTTIVYHYLRCEGLNTEWVDARQIVKTDASYTNAKVIWSLTEENILDKVAPKMISGKVMITQGFIASSTDGKVTTLGREGSDYTAAIFANALDAMEVIVWKDVKGILNGDPKIVENAVKHDNLSYEEAVEMTFYGATVIHPKTIKPLFTKSIPLRVKCFADLEEKGTLIAAGTRSRSNPEITSTILKQNQVLLRITPKDFSFMESALIFRIFNAVAKSDVSVNLVQSSAISMTLCVTDKPKDLREFLSLLMDDFAVEEKKGLSLTTLMNFQGDREELEREAVLVQQAEGKLFVVK